MISGQFQMNIKNIRTDNGLEFVNKECQQFFFSNIGIIHKKKSCVFTPQQNGIVEWKHRHLLQLARSLMF